MRSRSVRVFGEGSAGGNRGWRPVTWLATLAPLREDDAMYVVTQHTILDRWKAVHATQGLTNPPAGIKLHLFLTDTEVSKAVCLWEADSLETIRDMVEEALGPSVNNEFFAVRESAAVGLQELTLGVTPAL